MICSNKEKILFIGDSITDAERDRSQGGDGMLGNGYVNLIHGALQTWYPSLHLRVLNLGVSGNTILDLEGRWKADVLEKKPDWLSIMIGINDVWGHFIGPDVPGSLVDIGRFEKSYEKLIRSSRSKLKGLILCTPFFIETNREDPMRRMMDSYGEVVKSLAEKYNALLIDVQAAFDSFLVHRHPSYLAWDRVHPNTPGHMIIARAWLDGIGMEWS